MTKDYIESVKDRAKEAGEFHGDWDDYVFIEIKSSRIDSGIEDNEVFYIEFDRPMWSLDGMFREYAINEDFHYLSLAIL